ncbi:TPA: mRNA surveillance protein pelota [Candidatus Woesearchaeota archaeon]|nr:Protein pelota-like protein [archaeon GW2011_AR15]MBS3103540.1 mRNA surveillance protein pelota [Candidatus Woesearchaeota archaeon]HIH41356.1 mRNA surveillance protein pelota [Candidatus Woesearchaeota archaeon]
MRIIKKDYRKNFVRAQVESMDDLWYLTYIIEKSDILKASTYRKVKLGKEDERNTKIIRKPVTLAIEVDKIEFSKYSNVLRVSGIIREGPDDIPLGSHHTISLEGGTEFSLQKQALLKYQIEKLEESAEGLNSKIMLVVHDREEAYFAQLKKYGFEMLGQIKGDVQKKADVKTETSDFFAAIKKTVEDYDKRHNFSNIIIASPGFWKEYIQKIITGDLKKKVVYATCSSVGVNGINEVIKRDEVQQVLKLEKFADESRKVEGFLGEIAKKGKAQYGLKEIKEAVDSGAVSELLVTDRLIQKKRQDNTFEQVEYMMKAVENMQGEVHIISSEHEAGSKLDGLGGMGAILRYKINY